MQQTPGVQPTPGIPGVSNPIQQQSLLSSQNQGIEGMVPSSQTSLPSSLGVPAVSVVGSSGVNTSLQSMVSGIDQPDGLVCNAIISIITRVCSK